ncbi:MAG: hypothetical protein ACTHLE_23440 [Agriterribacter sp.]
MVAILNILLILVYLIVISFVFIIINKKKGTPIHSKWLIAAFIAKVLAGFAYGFVYAHYFEASDSWMLYNESLKEYHNLLHNPAAFFSTDMQFNSAGDLFSNADGATWKNTDDNLFIKLLGILNVLSGGSYYVTVVLFNFFPTLGLYYLYLTAQKQLSLNKLFLFLLIFFLPSCLFWNSGIHKDGLIVFFMGAFIYCVHQYIYNKPAIVPVFTALVCVAFIFLFRNVTALLLLPATAAWCWTAQRSIKKTYLPYIIIYGIAITLFFFTALLPQKFNLPLQLALKQHDFLSLKGGSLLPLTPLEPTVASYCKVLPEALNHVFLRPYPGEISGIFQLMSFAETLLVLVIIIATSWKFRPAVGSIILRPFSLFLLAVAVSGLLLTGYIIPFTGAIVRYKSFYIVLLLIPFAGAITGSKKTLRSSKSNYT